MPKCGVCGQDADQWHPSEARHCTTCREPIHYDATYWAQRRPYGLADRLYCEQCITWTKHADHSVLRRAESLYRRSLR